jgi:hypothetical protein
MIGRGFDPNGRRFKLHSRCAVFKKPGWDGVEIHGHCGLFRWRKVSQILLLTPFDTLWVIPEELWDEDGGFARIFGAEEWTDILTMLNEVPNG